MGEPLDLSNISELPGRALQILIQEKKVIYYCTATNGSPFELVSFDDIGIMGYRLERMKVGPNSPYRRGDSGRPVIIPWRQITEIQLTVEDVL